MKRIFAALQINIYIWRVSTGCFFVVHVYIVKQYLDLFEILETLRVDDAMKWILFIVVFLLI